MRIAYGGESVSSVRRGEMVACLLDASLVADGVMKERTYHLE